MAPRDRFRRISTWGATLVAFAVVVAVAPGVDARRRWTRAPLRLTCDDSGGESHLPLPGSLRVIALERSAGEEPVAHALLPDGRLLTLRVGMTIRDAEVREVRFDEAVVVVREPLDDPRLIQPYKDHQVRQAGVVPGDWLAGSDSARCPVGLVRVEAESAVFREAGGRRAALRRVAAGDELCAGWVVASIDREAGVRGVVVLAESATGRRVALGGLLP